MAEEVVYADLRVPGGTAATPARGSPRGCPLPPSLALAAGLILGTAIGALGVLASGRPMGPPLPTAPACNGSMAELAAALRGLCGEGEEEDESGSQGRPKEEGGRSWGRPKAPCALCPPGWTPRAAACYRFSTRARTWDDAAHDCAARAARLLGPRDLPAVASLAGAVGGPNPLWVGLRFRPHAQAWLWPDGSQQAPPSGQRGGQGRDCGVLHRGEWAPESCGAELRWLCRRDALLL
ncbi:killer cell lectin-like receptor subfamily F member 2 [Chlamydotis macqueenii]